MAVQQQAESSGNSDPPLSKQKTMETFKLQQNIQMESMDKMMREGMNQQPRNQEEQMMAMMKMVVAQAQTSDKLFLETGVEEDHLNHSISSLNLQEDAEFQHLVKANMEAVMKKVNQNGAQGQGPGGMF